MSRKPNEAPAETPKKATKPKKEKAEKKPKAPRRGRDFNPVAAAMLELQRQEVMGNVISGLVVILIGVITILVSLAKYRSTLETIEPGDDKTLAYAWIVYAVTGFFIGVIGIYEILKSFISMDQIKEWTRNAESHASPFQEAHEVQNAAEMNQSQSTEPAPTEGMAEDGSQAKKHFAWLGKKEEPRPDSGAIYDRYNPPAQSDQAAAQPPVQAPIQPPAAESSPAPKLNYGRPAEREKTFAERFMEENRPDPFAAYQSDAAADDDIPQFFQGTTAQAAAPQIQGQQPPEQPSYMSAGTPEPLSGSQGGYDDGFFLGTTSPQPHADLKKPEPIPPAAPPTPTVQPPAIPKAGSQPMPTVKPPEIPKAGSQPVPTVRPPEIPKAGSQPMPTVKPPEIPKQGSQPMPTVKPPEIPKQGSQQLPPMSAPAGANMPPMMSQTMPPLPNQRMPQMQVPYGYAPQMPAYGYRPQPPVQNMYQPLPNLQGAPGMMPGQAGYAASPFGFAGAFVDSNSGAYNPAMPPYTVHPFSPVGQQPAEQSYNPAMPPYTVHAFNPIGQPSNDQSYNPAMPPYTVHAFKPIGQQPAEQSYNPAMPPYTVHAFKPVSAETAADPEAPTEAYNPAMPPYTVHAFKPAAAPTEDSAESYNPAMPPYTVHPVKPTESGAKPQMYMPTETQAAPQTPIPAPIPEPTPQPEAPRPEPAPQPEAPRPAPVPETPAPTPEQQPKRTLRGVMTRRSSGDQSGKKPPITQRLGEYTFSLFEELGSGSARSSAPRSRRSEVKKRQEAEQGQAPNGSESTGGNSMAFGNRGGEQSPKKKSFSEMFLSRQGKKAESAASGAQSEIVKGGTPAQRKFVDAADFDEWECPGCGKINQEYVGVCACGERKPRVKW